MDAGTRSLETRPLARSTAAYLASWVGAAGAAAVLRSWEETELARYFGPIDPLVAVGAVGAAGLVALRALDRQGWVGVASGTTRPGRRARTVIGVAAGFGGAIVVADTLLGFPRGINVGWPNSLLFYPVMGFVAEGVFHLIPLAVVVGLHRRLTARKGHVAGAVVVPIGTVALVEAIFQMVFGGGGGRHEPWLTIYTGFHLFGFGAAQLAVLRRYGFGSMFLTRLAYYLVWHVGWGVARLRILF
jgi:hypothetical protein